MEKKEERETNLKVAFYMWNGESFHIHQLKDKFWRSFWQRHGRQQKKTIIIKIAQAEEDKDEKEEEKELTKRELTVLTTKPFDGMNKTVMKFRSPS